MAASSGSEMRTAKHEIIPDIVGQTYAISVTNEVIKEVKLHTCGHCKKLLERVLKTLEKEEQEGLGTCNQCGKIFPYTDLQKMNTYSDFEICQNCSKRLNR